jgi:hypothetical protein
MNNIKLLIFENMEFFQLENRAISCPFVEIRLLRELQSACQTRLCAGRPALISSRTRDFPLKVCVRTAKGLT